MHSYTVSNRDMREEWLAKIKIENSKLSPGNTYPNNVISELPHTDIKIL